MVYVVGLAPCRYQRDGYGGPDMGSRLGSGLARTRIIYARTVSGLLFPPLL